jgi:hypothetical protein
MLLMVYYVFHLAYSKLYQVLGFLLFQVLKDIAAESAFQKSVNFKMFEKKNNQLFSCTLQYEKGKRF